MTDTSRCSPIHQQPDTLIHKSAICPSLNNRLLTPSDLFYGCLGGIITAYGAATKQCINAVLSLNVTKDDEIIDEGHILQSGSFTFTHKSK